MRDRSRVRFLVLADLELDASCDLAESDDCGRVRDVSMLFGCRTDHLDVVMSVNPRAVLFVKDGR